MLRRTFQILALQICALTMLGCVAENGQAQSADQWKTVEPTAQEADEGIQLAQAEVPNLENAAVYKVKFETSKGDFVVEVHPDWRPRELPASRNWSRRSSTTTSGSSA